MPYDLELIVRTCPEAISGDECAKLPKLEFGTDTKDREAWQFEWLSSHGDSTAERNEWFRRYPGYYKDGLYPDVIVVGSREKCEALRQELQQQKLQLNRTYPCEGPLYFHLLQ